MSHSAHQTDIGLLFDQAFDLVSLLDHVFLCLHSSHPLTKLTLSPGLGMGFWTAGIILEEWRHFDFGDCGFSLLV